MPDILTCGNLFLNRGHRCPECRVGPCAPRAPRRPRRRRRPVDLEPKSVCEVISLLRQEDDAKTLRSRKVDTHVPREARRRAVEATAPRAAPRRPAPRARPAGIRPPMDTRMRFISHCATTCEAQDLDNLSVLESLASSSASSTAAAGGRARGQRGGMKRRDLTVKDDKGCRVSLPLPPPVLVHERKKAAAIVTLGSPKESGEVIRARPALPDGATPVPPLPPKVDSAHSGIYIGGPHNLGAGGGGPFEGGECMDMPPNRKGRKHKKTCGKVRCNHFACRKRRQMARDKHLMKEYCVSGRGRRRRLAQAQRRLEDACDDGVERPQQVQYPQRLRGLQTHSLTALLCSKEPDAALRYGILSGSLNMYDAQFAAASRGRQALTTCVMAYCLAFHYHPKQWTTKLLDSLVRVGDEWYLQCLAKVHDHSAVGGMCEVLPFGRKQVVALNRKRMQVLLGEPEIIGYTLSTDPTVYNLCRALAAFFKDHRCGLLLTRTLKIIIWKDQICYYVFDPAGRDANAVSNPATGKAALINMDSVRAVSEVLLARSPVEDQRFLLAPVKVLKVLPEDADEDFDDDQQLTSAERAATGFRILNENYAICNASMHLGDRSFEDAKYRQSLPIAVVALTYSKVSPPNTWCKRTIDKIIRLGNKLYVDCKHPKTMIDLTIDNIPSVIDLGPYHCEIIIYRHKITGQLFGEKPCFYNIHTGIAEFFDQEYRSAIIEFSNYTLAVWMQKEMFYLFDPYPRNEDGSRSMGEGNGCALMMLDAEAVSDSITKNFDYLPDTTPFCIHAFKVLKLNKDADKTKLTCTLSSDDVAQTSRPLSQRPCRLERGDAAPGAAGGGAAGAAGGAEAAGAAGGVKPAAVPPAADDEADGGDVVSLVDSIQEGYVPPVPRRHRTRAPAPAPVRTVNLDSPTASVTQLVPPWPRARDKANELADPDPSPEPTPPPTPPPPPEGAGAEEEEEMAMDEEAAAARLEEEARRAAELAKLNELPPPLTPPPSPLPEPDIEREPAYAHEPEEELRAAAGAAEGAGGAARRVLLAADARQRFLLRRQRQPPSAAAAAAAPRCAAAAPSQEMLKPSNFVTVLDGSQLIMGSAAVNGAKLGDVLPFAAIMAIVTSYKYTIDTWNSHIVTFVATAGEALHKNKMERFQFAPIHVIPKIAIGHQTYEAVVDVVSDGATWRLEQTLRKFFASRDRAMTTTCNYSAAVFAHNGLYYLMDAAPCSGLGLREKGGKACLMRFKTLKDMCNRLTYNKHGIAENQQFILSAVQVRALLPAPRLQLPPDYDFDTHSSKSKSKIVPSKASLKSKRKSDVEEEVEKNAFPRIGYRMSGGIPRIEGTSALPSTGGAVRSCHYAGLVAMFLATIHPVPTWDSALVDTCLEKGTEIYAKATNRSACDRRVIKNIILEGKYVDLNIKRILVVNENDPPTLEQALRAVCARLRFVMLRFPDRSCAVVRAGGLHLFDPYAAGAAPPPASPAASQTSLSSREAKRVSKDSEKRSSKESARSSNKRSSKESAGGRASSVESVSRPSSSSLSSDSSSPPCRVASWSRHRSPAALAAYMRAAMKVKTPTPDFYTFELTSMRRAPAHSALFCKLSPLYRPHADPSEPYRRRRPTRPAVDERLYWLRAPVPWSPMAPANDAGVPRGSARSAWRSWSIEFPGDLYSLWGRLHIRDARFGPRAGKQALAVLLAALAALRAVPLAAWTPGLLDGVVEAGDKYHRDAEKALGADHGELLPDNMPPACDHLGPYKFSVKCTNLLHGYLYNLQPDRFNLSKALAYFFEEHETGLLVSSGKNLAFGRLGASYFMVDCQSCGQPLFPPGSGGAYILKCESLNRLVYCMTVTLNVKRHGEKFNLYNVAVSVSPGKGK